SSWGSCRAGCSTPPTSRSPSPADAPRAPHPRTRQPEGARSVVVARVAAAVLVAEAGHFVPLVGLVVARVTTPVLVAAPRVLVPLVGLVDRVATAVLVAEPGIAGPVVGGRRALDLGVAHVVGLRPWRRRRAVRRRDRVLGVADHR